MTETETAKRTPGPILSHNDIDGSEILYVEHADGMHTTIARVYTGEHHGRHSLNERWPTWAEGMAHSQLFRAAPKLVEALERIVARATRPALIGTVYDGVESLQGCLRDIEAIARAAIAKATKGA